jgi:hypothetical protein
MKKSIILTAIFCLLAISAYAQEKKATDFSGNWTLDVSKSKLDERARIESMTLNVSQTGKEIKVETATKRAARPEGETPGGGMGRGGERPGGGFGGDGAAVYNLDGKEMTMPASGGQPGGLTTVKAEVDKDNKLKVTSTRKISSPMGDFTFTTKETWEITDGGKTLKIVREMETRRGNMTSEMVFTKK